MSMLAKVLHQINNWIPIWEIVLIIMFVVLMIAAEEAVVWFRKATNEPEKPFLCFNRHIKFQNKVEDNYFE